MIEYVVGFLFSPDHKQVALIRKNRPDWQAGKWNGIGGKVEPGEGPHEAMRREFREEAGVSLPGHEFLDQWRWFMTMRGQGFRLHYYRAFSSAIYNLESCTDERVDKFYIPNLPPSCLPGLRWQIEMALSMDADRAVAFEVTEVTMEDVALCSGPPYPTIKLAVHAPMVTSDKRGEGF